MIHFDEDMLSEHVSYQIKNFFRFDIDIRAYQKITIEKTEYCLRQGIIKDYHGSGIVFSPFHSSLYCIYLYFLSRVMFLTDGNGHNAEKVYYLNKALNSTDLFYEIELPDIFGVEHPIGSVMGRAKYGDGFFFYQGCTVGGNFDKYPTLGKRVIMHANSKILGDSNVGNNVLISANTYLINATIPDNSIVFGQGRDIQIVVKNKEEILQRMKDLWNNEMLK